MILLIGELWWKLLSWTSMDLHTPTHNLTFTVYAILIFMTAGGFFVQDFFGRRTLLICGGTVMAICLLAVGGITTVTPAPTGARANACVALSEWNVGSSLDCKVPPR